MNIMSEKAKAIDAYINSHSDAELGKWPLEIGGQKTILPFYRFPIKELLCYNVNNGRLAMDVRDWEKQNGRKLDPLTENDSNIIRDLLLNLDKNETIQLKEDIRKKNQMEPGVITHDGFVLNGNRRMAVLEELHAEEPTGKWLCLEAVRLPSTITERDIWKIEAGLQLSKDKIAEYHPVNELLKIKQGVEAKLSIEEIAAAMYGRTVGEVKDSLERLTLIENFLGYFSQESNYGVIRKFGLHEYFIDIQKNIVNAWRRRGLNGRQRQQELLNAFALIAAHIRIQGQQIGRRRDRGITHWDIRKMGRIFADLDANEVYTQNLRSNANVDPSTLIDDFKNAEEILTMKDQRDQPLRLIGKAIKALQSIDRTNKHFKEQNVKDAVVNLSILVQEIEKYLGS